MFAKDRIYKIDFEAAHVMLNRAAQMELSDPKIDVSINTSRSHTCFSRATKADIDRIKLSVEHQDPRDWHLNAPTTHVADGPLPASVEAMLAAMQASTAIADADEA
jgi:hypothetical protein